MARKKKPTYSRALSIVRKFSPKVTTVQDATRDISITVSKHDATTSARRKHEACAMAVACKRKFHLDNVIMSRTTAYLVKGPLATRYKVGEYVTREVVAFDRGGKFQPGTYALERPRLDRALGAKMYPRTQPVQNLGENNHKHHNVTKDMRAVLTMKAAD